MHPNDSRGKDVYKSRSFKRFCRKGQGSAGPVEGAYLWGMSDKDRANPYPKGARRDAFAQGQKVCLEEFLEDCR